MTFTKARWSTLGPMLVLAGGLCWSSCEALEKGAALSVVVVLNPPSHCSTSLLDSSFGFALSSCQASSFQLSAIHPSWKQTTMSGTTQLQIVASGQESGLLGSSLKHWALVLADRASKLNKLSEEISHYELRVDY